MTTTQAHFNLANAERTHAQALELSIEQSQRELAKQLAIHFDLPYLP